MGTLLLLLTATVLLATGCGASFGAEPSTFEFEGTSWTVSSAELADELDFPPVLPASPSDVLLIVVFDPQDDQSASIKESLRAAFGQVILKGSNKSPDQVFPHSEESDGPVDSMSCVFSVPTNTTAAELLLPNSQLVSITLKQ
jgi:hypothetical protein